MSYTLSTLQAIMPKSPQRSEGLPKSLVFVVVMVWLFLRVSVSVWPHSGMNTPPKFGDFEAQRHWMEITVNTPPEEWYMPTETNDLNYWGLDYPPLTAYHSWLCGKVAQVVYPEMVALTASRGIETAATKFFMRWSVIVSEALIFLPAVFAFASLFYSQTRSKILVLLLLVANPGFILIDHGHFQYNSVSLGLALWAIVFLMMRDSSTHETPLWAQVAASICFCLSLGFKQIALYYAPVFFFYLLGLSLRKHTWTKFLVHLMVIGVTVIGTLVVLFLPFLSSLPLLQQVFHRMFPFHRGLFEDKVASFWCVSSVLIKWRDILSQTLLVRVSLLATIAAFLPSCLNLLLRPTRVRFIYSLACTSLSFFMFSFHVHEKSILFPLLPIALLMGNSYQLPLGAFSILATASMFPLLEREGLSIAYFVLQILFLLLCWDTAPESTSRQESFIHWMAKASVVGVFVLHVVVAVMPEIPRYRDLKAVLFVSYCGVWFGLTWLGLTWVQLTRLPRKESTDLKHD